MSANQVRIATVFVLGMALLGGVEASHSGLGANNAPVQDKSAPPKPQDKKDNIDEKTIAALIKQLGDDSFERREAADKQLAAIGEPAIELLKKAIKDSTDAEVRQRAEGIIRSIGELLFVQVRQSTGHVKGQAPGASRVVLTPDGKQALSIGTDALRSWDLVSGQEKAVWERKGGYCGGLAVSANNKRVIMGCVGLQCHVWDLVTGKRVFKPYIHTGPVWGVALSADGKLAVSGGEDKTIRVWEVDTHQEIRSFDGVVDEVRCLALAGDAKQVVSGHFSGPDQPGTVRLWDIGTGKQIHAFEGHKLEISGVAFSPDGKTLLSTSFDKTVKLWDAATGKELKTLEGHAGKVEFAAFTPDGKRVVSCGGASNPTLRLWDVATGKQLLESAAVRGGFFGVATLADNRQCVSAGGDGVVRLWKWAR